MITSWFTLKKCTDYFHRHYRHAVLGHCVTFRKNELMLIFRDRSALTVHLGTPFQYIIPSSRPPSQKRDKVRIFPGIEGNIVEEVSMLPGERIMRFRMKNGTSLNIVFRSNRGNVVYLSESGTEYFKKKLRIDPGLLKKEKEEQYSSLQEDVRFNSYWKKHIGEVLGTGDYREILEIIHNSNGCMLGKRFVLCNDEKEYDPDLFYANYRAFVIGRLQEQQFYSEYRSLERRINTELNDLQKKLQRTENDEKFIERAKRYRFFADILSSCRYDIEEHRDKFTIPPFYRDPDFPYEIPLKKDMNISENIERYYRKARNSEKQIEENRNRNRELRARFREWNRYYGIFQQINSYRDLKAWKKKFADILPPADKTSRGIGERRPYYEHVTADKWRVWVGRSAKDNDEMTFKYAAKNDIWLHARNSTGSHVIIKKDGKKEVPRHIIGLAASLAARNSEEKHSTLVPVAYTERKYVTKGKGLPPGKVHFQFEKDIMVKPAELK